MPAPSRLVLHQTNQVFLDDSHGRSEDARLAAREVSAAAAVGAVAGVRAAIAEDAQVSSETVAEAAASGAASAIGSGGQHDNGTKAVVVKVATAAAAADAAPARRAAAADAVNTVCNPKVPTGVMRRPQPNPCPWWSAMHKKFVEQIQVRTEPR